MSNIQINFFPCLNSFAVCNILQIHDGAHGFSEKIGKYCGHNFPDTIDSKGRFLWLHFHSDENIEHQGFKAVYDFVPRPTSGTLDSPGYVLISRVATERTYKPSR